jgi:penicillin-binding protein 2
MAEFDDSHDRMTILSASAAPAGRDGYGSPPTFVVSMKRLFLTWFVRISAMAAVLSLLTGSGFALTKKRHHHLTHHAAAVSARVPVTAVASHSIVASPLTGVVRGGPWTEPTFADSTQGDNVDAEDLEIRRAAVDALGPYNGSIVVVDPSNGRVLSMVNQKLALSSGFQPCSTIKVSVALAALAEKVIEPTTKLRLGGARMDLTYALAHSNNYFFATLGQKVGFEKFSNYAHQFGYGEKAGLDIPGEQPGRFPVAAPTNGGMGMLSSFGEEIAQTPLELVALISAIANGGTLYYLQYPRTPQDAATLVPRVKRKLEIEALIPGIKPGMLGAVQFGTAHRARQEEPIAGKTGTCTDNNAHLGWFGSFNNDVAGRRLAAVVLLTGGRPVAGPVAAGIAGDFYRRLSEKNYFAGAASRMTATPATLFSH